LILTFSSSRHQQSKQQEQKLRVVIAQILRTYTKVWQQQLIWIWKEVVRLLRVCRTFAIWSRREFVISDQNKDNQVCFDLDFSCESSLHGSKQQQQDEFVLILTLRVEDCFDFED
jgi:hypothetical protein